MSAAQHFFKNYFRPEVTPLVLIIGGALGGATYVALHAARAPDVVWDHKSNTRLGKTLRKETKSSSGTLQRTLNILSASRDQDGKA